MQRWMQPTSPLWLVHRELSKPPVLLPAWDCNLFLKKPLTEIQQVKLSSQHHLHVGKRSACWLSAFCTPVKGSEAIPQRSGGPSLLSHSNVCNAIRKELLPCPKLYLKDSGNPKETLRDKDLNSKMVNYRKPFWRGCKKNWFFQCPTLRNSVFIFLVAYTSCSTFSVLYVLLIISIKAWFPIPRLKLTV